MAVIDFSPEDMRILRETVRRVLGDTVNFGRGQSQHEQYEDHQAPEVYIAKTPSGGIPALTAGATGTGTDRFDEPGSALCDIYCIDKSDATPDLRDIGLDELVYNYTDTATDGSTYIQVTRDKFGDWLASVPPIAAGSRRRFKLKTALVKWGSATAWLRSVVGSVMTTTDTEFTVWDELGVFEGDIGTFGLAEYWSDQDTWEVYQMACEAYTDTGTGTP